MGGNPRIRIGVSIQELTFCRLLKNQVIIKIRIINQYNHSDILLQINF